MSRRTRQQLEAARRDYRAARYPGRLADVLDGEPDRTHRHGSMRLWTATAAAAGLLIAAGLWWSMAKPSEPTATIAPPTATLETPPVDQPIATQPAAKPLRLVRARKLSAFDWPRLRPGSKRSANTPQPPDATASNDTAAPASTDQSRVAALRKPTRPTLSTPRLRAATPKLRSFADAS